MLFLILLICPSRLAGFGTALADKGQMASAVAQDAAPRIALSQREIAHVPNVGARWRAAVASLLLAVVGAIQPVLAEEDATESSCQRAGQKAEVFSVLPPELLLAIGVVESGRRDPVSGHLIAWPWTINANGVGRQFDSRAEALAEARALQERGVTSLDVGCFQVNLLQHPAAFASLEEAFDPQANAAYAARFLMALRTRTGSWAAAIAAYHSATPERGKVYLANVMARMTQAGLALGPTTPPINRVVVWSPAPATDGVRIWKPSTSGLGANVILIRLAPNETGISLPVITTGTRLP